MSVIMRNDIEVGGTDDGIIAKVGTDTLDTTAQDLSGAINEHEEDISELNSNLGKIMHGTATYNDLGQGGYANRITVKVTLPKPMPNNNYYATAEVANAYADFPYISCYIFEKTTTSFDVMLIDSQTGTGKVGGLFKWLVVGV